jgi:hypothetical protein
MRADLPGKARTRIRRRQGLAKGQRQVHINVTVPAGHPVGATAEVFDLNRRDANPSPAPPEPFVLVMQP